MWAIILGLLAGLGGSAMGGLFSLDRTKYSTDADYEVALKQLEWEKTAFFLSMMNNSNNGSNKGSGSDMMLLYMMMNQNTEPKDDPANNDGPSSGITVIDPSGNETANIDISGINYDPLVENTELQDTIINKLSLQSDDPETTDLLATQITEGLNLYNTNTPIEVLNEVGEVVNATLGVYGAVGVQEVAVPIVNAFISTIFEPILTSENYQSKLDQIQIGVESATQNIPIKMVEPTITIDKLVSVELPLIDTSRFVSVDPNLDDLAMFYEYDKTMW